MHRISLDIEELKKARELIMNATRILIISHRNPDADSVGSNRAFAMALESIGKNVQSACADPLPQNLHFIHGASSYVTDINPEEYDVIITVDCGAHQLVKYHESIPNFFALKPLINIDHHETNDRFGSVNIVDPQCAATAALIFYVIQFLEIPMTAEISTCLLAGLYYDTGSFKHSNTTPEILRIAATLTRNGGDYKKAVKELFKTAEINKLKLWGRALARARLNDKHILVSNISEEDFRELNIDPTELSGVIDYLNTIPESKFCILLAEDLKGNIKGSCRTLRDDIDLSLITSLLGGGGHKKAAGFTLPGSIKEEFVRHLIIS